MASIDIRPLATGSFGGSVKTKLERAFGVVATWNDARVTRNELFKLSGHELYDIGLNRGDIDVVARRA